ncbi:MAG: hypothetical protein ACE14P_00330 [Methanotrichaceae archaeon]
MAEIWSGKAPDRCGECNRKIDNVFYNAKIAACEGFRQMQVCEACFERSKMLGRGMGDRYERDSRGRYVKVQAPK